MGQCGPGGVDPHGHSSAAGSENWGPQASLSPLLRGGTAPHRLRVSPGVPVILVKAVFRFFYKSGFSSTGSELMETPFFTNETFSPTLSTLQLLVFLSAHCRWSSWICPAPSSPPQPWRASSVSAGCWST